jgi:hypothetical protein
MNDDPEISLMQWMSVDELTRYSNALETIEREEALYAELSKEIDPKRPLIEYKEAFESMWRLCAAQDLKTRIVGQTIDRVKATSKAWDKLKEMALAGIAGLVDAGVTPDNCGGSERFWRLVYQHLLKTYGARIKDNPDFQHVQIMQFLKRVLPNRLPEFAFEYRQRGHPILAQVMEQLADELPSG